jgi:hypothetical protein
VSATIIPVDIGDLQRLEFVALGKQTYPHSGNVITDIVVNAANTLLVISNAGGSQIGITINGDPENTKVARPGISVIPILPEYLREDGSLHLVASSNMDLLAAAIRPHL